MGRRAGRSCLEGVCGRMDGGEGGGTFNVVSSRLGRGFGDTDRELLPDDPPGRGGRGLLMGGREAIFTVLGFEFSFGAGMVNVGIGKESVRSVRSS